MIRSLEGVRGIAALIVALYHLKIGSDYFAIIRNGYLFVDLFFVLSGFVMCAAYATTLRTMDDVRPFLIRRIGRLFPLLVFSTVIFVLVADGIVFAKQFAVSHGYGAFLNSPGALQYLVPTTAEVLSTLTLTHSLGIFDHLILNTPTWSISTEFYTYLVFAAVCLMFVGRSRLIVFALLCIAGLLISDWASVNIYDCISKKNGCLSLTYDYGFPRCVSSFFLGALSYYTSRRFCFNPTSLQLTAGLALAILFALVDYVPAAAFAFPVAFALLVLAISTDTGPLCNALKPKLFQALGQRSYSIYLMHMPLLLIFENLSKRAAGIMSLTAILLAYVAVLYVVSGWTYRWIENPFRIWFNHMATDPAKSAIPARTEAQ
jgi:peptidoglycan/LPS O-acetylase OafA/YrhL